MKVTAYFTYDVFDVAEYIDKEMREFPDRSKEQNAWNATQKYLESFNNEAVQFWFEDDQINEIYEKGLKEYYYEYEMDDEPYDIDSDAGFDPYMGCFTNDC